MSGSGGRPPGPPRRPPHRSEPERAIPALRDLIDYIVRQLVDGPGAFQIRARRRGRTVVLRLSVEPEQLGKVIGREGKIARAMRTMLSIAAIRYGVHASLTIDDQIERTTRQESAVN